MKIKDERSAYELRKVGFLANTLAQNSINETSKFASRVYAQAIATGYMRGHSIVSADYAIKVLNVMHNNQIEPVIAERQVQIELAERLLDNQLTQ